MNKKTGISICLLSILFFGCMTTSGNGSSKVKIEYDSAEPIATIDVYPKYTTGSVFGIPNNGYEGFSVNIKNNTSKVVKLTGIIHLFLMAMQIHHIHFL